MPVVGRRARRPIHTARTEIKQIFSIPRPVTLSGSSCPPTVTRSSTAVDAASSSNAPLCEECNERTRQVYCNSCNVELCTDCSVEIHRHKSLREHEKCSIFSPTPRTGRWRRYIQPVKPVKPVRRRNKENASAQTMGATDGQTPSAQCYGSAKCLQLNDVHCSIHTCLDCVCDGGAAQYGVAYEHLGVYTIDDLAKLAPDDWAILGLMLEGLGAQLVQFRRLVYAMEHTAGLDGIDFSELPQHSLDMNLINIDFEKIQRCGKVQSPRTDDLQLDHWSIP